MTTTPPRDVIHAEMERARGDFRTLVQNASATDLARRSDGTRWTNRQLLFHMMFGYLIAWNLRPLVKLVSRLPLRGQRAFAAPLDAANRPFHLINYGGSCAGAWIVNTSRMAEWFDCVIASLHRHLDAETEAALHRSMAFPTSWDPYFGERMNLAQIYHYATQHFDHHRRQLTLTDNPPDAGSRPTTAKPRA